MAEIQDNFVLLCNELDLNCILPFLRQKGLLTTEEYEQLLFSGLSLKEKRERLLLSIIPRKGRTHFEKFCQCLILSGQKELARKLGYTNQNEYPTNPPPQPGAITPPSGTPQGGATSQPPPQLLPPLLPPSSLAIPPVSTRPHPLSVLIVYAKDVDLRTLQPPFQRSAEQYCEEVERLADTLTLFSSVTANDGTVVPAFKCIYDSDNIGFIPDWLQWFEEALTNADCILLLCSPILFMSLRIQGVLEMMRGKCNISTLAHYMTKKCCIPVFLNMPRQPEWIPVSLRAATSYELQVDVLHQEIGNVDGMTEQQFSQAAVRCFASNPQLSSLNQLLQVLRRDLQPPPPLPPVTLPSVGVPVSQIPWTTGSEWTVRNQLQYIPSTTSLGFTQSSHFSSPGTAIPDQILCDIAAEVTNIWEHLGVKLGVSFSKIQTARSSNPGNLQSAVIAMLRMWQAQKGKDATPKALKTALLELKYKRVAVRYFPKD